MRLVHAIALARARWRSTAEAGQVGFAEERQWTAGLSPVVTMGRRKLGGPWEELGRRSGDGRGSDRWTVGSGVVTRPIVGVGGRRSVGEDAEVALGVELGLSEWRGVDRGRRRCGWGVVDGRQKRHGQRWRRSELGREAVDGRGRAARGVGRRIDAGRWIRRGPVGLRRRRGMDLAENGEQEAEEDRRVLEDDAVEGFGQTVGVWGRRTGHGRGKSRGKGFLYFIFEVGLGLRRKKERGKGEVCRGLVWGCVEVERD